MLGILANSFMTATRTQGGTERRINHKHRTPTSWLEEELPFRRFAGQRSGRHD